VSPKVSLKKEGFSVICQCQNPHKYDISNFQAFLISRRSRVSNPSLSATTQKSPKIGLSKRKTSSLPKSKILSAKNYDTSNLYKVNDVYYFRTRIDNKLYRKSLKTESLKNPKYLPVSTHQKTYFRQIKT